MVNSVASSHVGNDYVIKNIVRRIAIAFAFVPIIGRLVIVMNLKCQERIGTLAWGQFRVSKTNNWDGNNQFFCILFSTFIYFRQQLE
jgi:hypothetical protein